MWWLQGWNVTSWKTFVSDGLFSLDLEENFGNFDFNGTFYLRPGKFFEMQSWIFTVLFGFFDKCDTTKVGSCCFVNTCELDVTVESREIYIKVSDLYNVLYTHTYQ